MVEKSSSDKNLEKRGGLSRDINATRDVLRAYIPLAKEAGMDALAHFLSNESAVMARYTESVGQLENNLAYVRGIQSTTYTILGDVPPEAMAAIRVKWYRADPGGKE